MTATERDLAGGGKVIWIPSPVGLGAWLTDPKPLARYLQTTFQDYRAVPLTLTRPQENCLLRVLKDRGAYLTVLTNGEGTSVNCGINAPGLRPTTLWGESPQNSSSEKTYTLEPRGIFVQLWEASK